MHTIAFIRDLAVIMLAAGVVTVVFRLLRQPVVLGYIAAGVLIGPYTPPYALVTDEETIRTLAELGVVFLLFSLGLEFSLMRLRQVGATAFIAAAAGIVTMMWLGYEVGLAFHWRTMDALFLGAMLSISSTTITIKALDDLGLKKQHFAQVVFGILIIEDVLAIGMLALLSSAAHTGGIDTGEVLGTLGKLTRFPRRLAGRSASSPCRACSISWRVSTATKCCSCRCSGCCSVFACWCRGSVTTSRSARSSSA